MNYPTRILQDFEKIRNENKSVLEIDWGKRMANQSLNQVSSKNNSRFIFELIQNANDAKAKKITFVIHSQLFSQKEKDIKKIDFRKKRIDKKIYCNFCVKYFGKTKQMFHNPDFKAHPYICNECVKICGAIAKDK